MSIISSSVMVGSMEATNKKNIMNKVYLRFLSTKRGFGTPYRYNEAVTKIIYRYSVSRNLKIQVLQEQVEDISIRIDEPALFKEVRRIITHIGAQTKCLLKRCLILKLKLLG